MSETDSACSVFWFRRDLRLEDNVGLHAALKRGNPVLCVFIFDEEILEELDKTDARVEFIHAQLASIHQELRNFQSSLICLHGQVLEAFADVLKRFKVGAVYTNRDYEPYARTRDYSVRELLHSKDVEFHTFKDQVIFEPGEILKTNHEPYTVFTPFKNAWLAKYERIDPVSIPRSGFLPIHFDIPSLEQLGFYSSAIKVRPFNLTDLTDYAQTRDIPSLDGTSYLSAHLRFGTVGIRTVFAQLKNAPPSFLNELIWREFFMHILYHFPFSVESAFKPAYDQIPWRNDPEEFKKWCDGETGYPLVDAGMRQLKATGLMHNRVRMVTASFLCKHLLIDWRWGEAHFARQLLDFDLSANVGNWQWAAGSGCDAAPYFRVFNPTEQQRKFDPEFVYIRQWLPEYGTDAYPAPMVDHDYARQRALDRYKDALKQS